MLNQYTPPPERLPCGCYGRCSCYAVGYIGLAAGAFIGTSIATCLVIACGREVVPSWIAGCTLGLMGLAFFGCVLATAAALLTERSQAAGSIWKIAKFYAGLAAGSVAAVGVTVLAILAWLR